MAAVTRFFTIFNNINELGFFINDILMTRREMRLVAKQRKKNHKRVWAVRRRFEKRGTLIGVVKNKWFVLLMEHNF
ncbi:hypothetical protein [Brenneria tiliae]|uniref:hypothetical protein n=1 Tax=Brenneria tiliae TaxID=2914984 RepID=UPI002014D3A4|nr:hypothetical protein [Brenneria tiliae]MCL2899269.1 hypothetical protein [Brenneria tiliae]MCL2903647.1 hypothetical protein [Brenneria tiliae]